MKIFDTPRPNLEPGAKIIYLNKQVIPKAISVLKILTDLKIS